MQTLIRRRVLRRLIWFCTVFQCASPGFTDNLFTRHSDVTVTDKNSAAINNRYPDTVQTRALISLVNDDHVDNLNYFLVYVYFGSILYNRPKNRIGLVITKDSLHYKLNHGEVQGERYYSRQTALTPAVVKIR